MCLILSKIVKPVEVNPETDSKNEFKLNMISEDTKVNISKELLLSLEEDEFLYKLN